MIDAFVSYIQTERRYSALTVRNYRRDLEAFAAWCAQRANLDCGDVDLLKVTADDIREWIIYRADEGKISPSSINRELSSLRSFYRFLRQRNLIDNDIFSRISAQRTSRRLPTFVPESRMEHLLDTMRAKSESGDFVECRDALIITILYGCGIRLAELCGVVVGSFNSDFSALRVCGKGEKERVVPLQHQLGERIQDFIALMQRMGLDISLQSPLVVSEKGRPLSRATIQRIVKRELGLASVQGKRSPHVLRHTFATHLMNREADMRDIQELMGHASLKSTQCYTHNSITQLQKIYERAHPHR